MKNNHLKIIFISLVLITTFSSKVFAQYDAMFTQYMNNEMFINPAYAGSKEALAVSILNRQQWTGFEGRPITNTFTIHSPVKSENVGLGLSFSNEKIGVLSHSVLYGSYSYRIKTRLKGSLSLGIMAGVHFQQQNFADVSTTVANDPSFSFNTPVITTPNFGFGALYKTDDFYIGLSIPRLLDDNIAIKDNKVDKQASFNMRTYHYYFAIGKVFVLNDEIKLKPQSMVKFVLDAPVEFDLNLNALIHDKLWLGVGYRSNADMSLMVGMQITKNLLLSYSYDTQLTQIRKYSGGSHEIMCSYIFNFRGKQVVSPRYF